MNASEPLIAKVRSDTISLTPLKFSNFIRLKKEGSIYP